MWDDFSDNCLEKTRWALIDELYGLATPIPALGECLNPRRQFFAQDDDHLSVFVDSDATVNNYRQHTLVPLTGPMCYKQVEVIASLDSVSLGSDSRLAYLSVGMALTRIAGNGYLEIRLQASNATGRFTPLITSRLTLNEGGYQDFGTLPYTLGQPTILTFSVHGNKLTAYANGQLLAGPFSIINDPCLLGLGYYADQDTTLDGYFDAVRATLIQASPQAAPP